MATVDIIILICLVPFVIQGLTKGLVAQVAALLSLIVGVWASYNFTEIVCGWLGQYLQADGTVLKIAAFVLIFVAVILVLNLAAKLIEGVLKLVMLGWLNRLLGLAFALIKGVLLIGLAIIIFSTLNADLHLVSKETLSASTLYTPLKQTAYTVFPYLKQLIVQ